MTIKLSSESRIQWNIELRIILKQLISRDFSELIWFGNKLVRKILVSGLSWSERTNSGILKQEGLPTNLSVSICNVLIIAMSYLDETFRKCYPDIPFGISITIKNMIHFKNNEKQSYGEIWKTLSEFTLLRVTQVFLPWFESE